MRFAYKMFNKDLTCTSGRGKYQYTEGEWFEEPEANCAKNGFHCAENPLDCLSYYPDWKNSVCYLVEVGGDVDEDNVDSKISCTKIRLVKRLTTDQFIEQAIVYTIQHPETSRHSLIADEEGYPGRYPFVFARGKYPRAKGRIGDTIVLLEEETNSKQIIRAGTYEIDGRAYKEDTFYNVEGCEA